MSEIIYFITFVVYLIFFIKFILSCFGGDFEIDTDLDIGDVVSFKGLIHFLMGFTGWLSTKNFITQEIQWYDYLIAFLIGILFVAILFYLYKLMLKLESKTEILEGKKLIGHNGVVFLLNSFDGEKFYYSVSVFNGIGTTTVSGYSTKKFKTNDIVILSDYDGAYYILI